MVNMCISLGVRDFKTCKSLLNGLDFAEIRMDRMRLTLPQVRELFSLPKILIATYRLGRAKEVKRRDFLNEAIRAGASYLDIEIESPARLREELIAAANRHHCRVIISYHNFRETPARPLLKKTVQRLFDAGADIAKIACRARSRADILNLFSLYELKKRSGKSILALGMGRLGAITRITAPFLGAPFTYASPDADHATASGQLDFSRMAQILSSLEGKRK